ncbi:related to Sorting nexin 9 [Serendipita indica DSM 11827]|uniref:Related to Sorting nexin 9 n=1 Tax=Serendipita indica (strain DSM 11827) TaxID=1109443 RepID=G4TPE2_SERID|nr:related to Sorting nexin 9 [Serendipita indica DSM 11827]
MENQAGQLLTPPAVDNTFLRPGSEFDAGLNASTAWTEHLERTSTYQSVSDDEKEPVPEGRPARALYDFEGRADFRELTMKAGDNIIVLKESLPDGWSLVTIDGEAGLVPATYYTFTTDFTTLHKKDGSNNTIGPNDSTPRSTTPPPLANQRTGEWTYGLPNFRQSLLGGKSLNRFSSFVTSGAEEWVLHGSAQDIGPTSPSHVSPRHERELTDAEQEEERIQAEASQEADQHFVDEGPVWKPKLPEFKVLVHSPSKRSSTLSGSYTVYTVTSVFISPPEGIEKDEEEEDEPPGSPKRISVHRRFSHFVFLHTALTKRLPGIALPPLPEKQYAGRFSEDFVEARRGDLERYLNRVIRHPIARYAEVLTFFLSCESEIEWRKRLPHHLALPPAGPQFYAKVFHPAFNLDAEDAAESVERFSRHLKAVGKGVQGLRGMFTSLRVARMELARYQRLFSYSLMSLITSTPLATPQISQNNGNLEDEEEEEDTSRAGLLNAEGAWCWREHCDVTHESLKDVAHPAVLYAPVIDTHKSTLSRYKSALKNAEPVDEISGRCETVLNTTMSEFSTYHSQKQEDFERLTLEHLNGEIELYTNILERLQAAKAAFYSPDWDELSAARSGPRQPSRLERDLSAVDPRTGRVATTARNGTRARVDETLVEPAPHVWDSAPMRPVSVAIQEGVGMLFGGSSVASLYGRTSVFGKFW